jgi:DNA-binding NarL/FixJ family response regulator
VSREPGHQGPGGNGAGRRLPVVIADDNDVVREALAAVISSDPSLSPVGAARDADEAISLAAEHHPAVAVVDVKMPGGGMAAAAGIRRVSPETKVIALTAHADRTTVLAMVGAGAHGYLVKGATADRILEAIHEIARGHGALSGEIAAEVLDELAGQMEAYESRLVARRARLGRVQRLLGGPQLRIELQPIVDLGDGRIAGVEALLRAGDAGAAPRRGSRRRGRRASGSIWSWPP